MKKITIICLLFIPLFFIICGFCLPEQYGDTFLGELKEKTALLQETEGNRIVLLGGSGVAFGYDSKMIKEAFPGYEVINFGMYAGLGTKVMLDLSEDRIREGDIVIISPEQERQTLSAYFDATYMWQAVDGDFALLASVKRENFGALASAFPDFAIEKLKYFICGQRPLPTDIYQKASFDENGDIRDELCGENVMPQLYDPNTPVFFSNEIMSEAFTEYLNSYAVLLEKKGAKVYYRFCPVDALSVQNEEEADDYMAWLSQQLDFAILGDPTESMMEAELFYDTNFHLNSYGKKINTAKFIRQLGEALGDEEAAAYELPENSVASSENEEQSGDVEENTAGAEFEQYFVWEEQDGCAVLLGLTEEGASLKQITIPSACGGLPVESLNADVFSGNTGIEEITIPEGISFLADGAFDGCTRLQRIVLESEDPSAVRPGQGLLKGTDAMLYVDKNKLSSYRLNYFWSVYADRIKADDT